MECAKAKKGERKEVTKKFKQKTMNGKSAMVQRKTKKNSEFQSYTYIKNELKELGWNIKSTK